MLLTRVFRVWRNCDKALRRAHHEVTKAGVEMRLVRGDVTALRAAGIGSGFRLVLDTGTFHDLKRTQRGAMGGRTVISIFWSFCPMASLKQPIVVSQWPSPLSPAVWPMMWCLVRGRISWLNGMRPAVW